MFTQHYPTPIQSKGHWFLLVCKLKIPRPAVINQSHGLCVGFAKGICSQLKGESQKMLLNPILRMPVAIFRFLLHAERNLAFE